MFRGKTTSIANEVPAALLFHAHGLQHVKATERNPYEPTITLGRKLLVEGPLATGKAFSLGFQKRHWSLRFTPVLTLPIWVRNGLGSPLIDPTHY